MEIKTTEQVHNFWNRGNDNWDTIKWVAVDDDVKEALSLYLHLKNHTEVQEAPKFKGMPICKICNKSAYQIMCEEWKSLSTSKKEGTELSKKERLTEE